MARGLTEKQERFCLEYMATGNATESYRRVYNTKKMKPETISRNAKFLIDDNRIATRMEELRAPLLEKAMITEERVLREIARIAFFDIRNIFDSRGKLLPIHSWSDDVAAAVSGIEVVVHGGSDDEEPNRLHKIKLCSKDKQLELAGKYLKLFTDKMEHTGANGGPIEFKNLTDEELLAIANGERS